MRTRFTVGAGGAALVVTAAVAGISLAGADGGGERREVADVVVAKPVTGVAPARRAQRGTRGPTIDFFYAQDKLVPVEGGGALQPIRCPRRAGNPIGGGARTDEGIVVSYLSRVSPGGNRPRRTYFVGVDDNSDDPSQLGAGAYVEVQCAKGLTVRP